MIVGFNCKYSLYRCWATASIKILLLAIDQQILKIGYSSENKV
jgi:hypothetical protein|tara:strand:+ start:883 stop:1011 length:129 start_codon:yes stop_codon:yes gene_type:complete